MTQKTGKCRVWSSSQPRFRVTGLPVSRVTGVTLDKPELAEQELCWNPAPLGRLHSSAAPDQRVQDQGALLVPEATELCTLRANKLRPIPRGGPCLDAWLIVNAQGKSSAARGYLGGKQHAGGGRQTAESRASASTATARTTPIQNITF